MLPGYPTGLSVNRYEPSGIRFQDRVVRATAVASSWPNRDDYRLRLLELVLVESNQGYAKLSGHRHK